MKLNPEMQWFSKTSNLLGSDHDLVQGTGGNISVKTDNKMIIKSSGVRLNSITENIGYVVVDYKKIADIYSRDEIFPEIYVDKIIRGAVVGGYGKPSIETGFHSFLGKYIIHLHPVSMNVILCSARSRIILSDIFGDIDFLWVPYVKVGHSLACEIKKCITSEPEIIFLENHGLIISSENPDCINTMNMIRQRINGYIKSTIPGFYPFTYNRLLEGPDAFINASEMALHNSNVVLTKFLFPDAAVFANSKKVRIGKDGIYYFMEGESARNVDEVLSAHAYLHEMIGKLGSPKYLSSAEVAELLNMGAEKYRRGLVGI